jgi:hypothetical protein
MSRYVVLTAVAALLTVQGLAKRMLSAAELLSSARLLAAVQQQHPVRYTVMMYIDTSAN